MTTYTILNLGAGVQSSAIYCLMADGELPIADYAVFSDTQEEPKWVYNQLEYLRTQAGPPIVEVSAGKIGEHLQHGVNSTGQRFASIPAHTTYQEGVKGGMTRRQCTREYKIAPIKKWVRRELLKLDPKQRIPKDVTIIQQYGFSTDESNRAVRMRVQFERQGPRWQCKFPLFHDDLMMSRLDCQRYIEERSGFQWRSSRCVFCPMQSNRHWQEIKTYDIDGWNRAVEVDEALRAEGSIVNRDMNEIMYVHRACIPLQQSKLDSGQSMLFDDDDGCDQGCFL